MRFGLQARTQSNSIVRQPTQSKIKIYKILMLQIKGYAGGNNDAIAGQLQGPEAENHGKDILVRKENRKEDGTFDRHSHLCDFD